MHIAFLTMDSLAGFECDDDLAIAPLAKHGLQVAMVPWKTGTEWNRFEAVIVRSPWDYQQFAPEFLRTLRQIESESRLFNSCALMEWNLNKGYLFDLSRRGAAIVPTIRGTGLTVARLHSLFEELQATEIVIKPVIGAGACRTHRLRWPLDPGQAAAAVADHATGEIGFLAQPFLPAIETEGEYSLVYFGGTLSHAILKTPKPGDFRSQEEFGSQLRAVVPEPSLLRAAERVLGELPEIPLYARVDLVRRQDQFLLMEVELVEPALYFRMSPGSAERFALAVAQRLLRTQVSAS